MASTIRIAHASTSLDFSPGAGTYEFANNEETGRGWTPTAATPQTLTTGGAPFVVESLIAMESHQNVTESIPFQIKGANHNACVASLRTLRQVLYAASENAPARLGFQPDTSTSGVTFFIWQGTVQENYRFVNDEAGRGTLRGVMTIRRSVWAVKDGSTGTSLGTGTIGNIPSGAPSNLIAFSGLAGERIYNGQPLDVKIASIAGGMFASAGVQRAYLATVLNADRTSVATAMTTASTSGITVATVDFGSLNPAYRWNVRVCGRITSPASNLEVRVRVVYGSAAAGSGATVYTSPWIAPGTTTTYVDFGFFRYPESSNFLGTAPTRFILEARSTNGLAVSGTWSDIERIVYATWCRITAQLSLTAPTLRIRPTAATGGSSPNGMLLLPAPYVAFETAAGIVLDYPEVRGRLPVALEGYSFMIVTLTGTTHDSTDTGTYTLLHTPLFTTLVGAG